MHKLYTDGGSRGNPGPAAAGFFIFNGKQGVIVDYGGAYLGECTNNIAEYQALHLGLKYALKNMLWELSCFLDSELIVKQLNGEYKVRDNHLKKFYEDIQELIPKFESITFTHVKRDKNKLADKMVNIILDSCTKV